MDKTSNKFPFLQGLLLNKALMYLEEFPDDKDFIETCNSPMCIDYDELGKMLTNRPSGMVIRARNTDMEDYMELYYEPVSP